MNLSSAELGTLSRLLLMFCHEPWSEGLAQSTLGYSSLSTAFARWLEVLPDFRARIQGARVIEFGCGKGFQAVQMALSGAIIVLAVEIDPKALRATAELAAASPAVDKIRIVERIPPDFRADLITSQNTFEHLLDAEQVLQEWKRSLAPEGQILITFAPPWYAPWGAHMAYFCGLPWVHLIFPEQVIMKVRSRFRKDGARTYEEAGLARMSLARFEKVVRYSGFQIVDCRYDCSWGLHFLSNVPLVRELFVNRVTAVLKLAKARLDTSSSIHE